MIFYQNKYKDFMMSLSSNKTLITGGCSFSAPGGINEKQTWVEYFQQKYNFDTFYHTGVGASGNEMITHRLLYSIESAIKNNLKNISLVVMWSEHIRNDIFTNNKSLNMETDNGNIMYTNHIHNNVIDGNWTTNSGFIRPGCYPVGLNDYRLDNVKQKEWLVDYYKNYYTEEYSLMNTLKNIILIQNICKQNNIKCVMFVMRNIFENVKLYPQLKHLYNLVDWDKFIFFKEKYGLYEYTAINDLEFWKDNFHPSFSAHKHFIDNYDKDIKNLL
jgi:hypothetical protein